MSNFFITGDVGGTKVLAALLDEQGKILARHKIRTERNSQKVLVEQIGAAVEQMQSQAPAGAKLKGIALGVPGLVADHKFVVSTPNAPLSQTPLGELLEKRFRAPAVIGNDVNLGMIGENTFGAARDADSSFGIFVGTGIGGGLVLNNQLIEGFRGLAGEIGHLMIPLAADEIDGMLTRKHTFLEEICSRTAIENQLRHAILKEHRKSALTDIVGDKKLERIRSGALKQALKKKDPLVTDVLRRASFVLGLATASVLHVVDPEVIVFGGGVIEACGDWMLPWIEKTTRKVALPGAGAPIKIVRSELGDDAILMGGFALLNPGVKFAVPPASTLNGATKKSPPPRALVDKPLRIK